MATGDWVYLNGSFCRAAEAAVSPFDRGFLFAQAAYEVSAVFNRKLVDFDGHVARLQRTLAGIDIVTQWDGSRLEALHEDLIRRNGLQEGYIYLQVTGGAYGNRDFAGPEQLTPGIFLFCEHQPLIGEKARSGISAILSEDQRWKRRDYKTTQLLSQVLAYREAARAGADSTILYEDGYVTEAASSNLWVVTAEGQIVTRNLGREILPGITRASIMERIREDSGVVEERAISLEELRNAREVFTTSTTGLVLPVVQLDGKPVHTGSPGTVTRRLQTLYYRAIGADLNERALWLTNPVSASQP